MRDVTRRLFRLLNSDHFDPVEMIDITLSGSKSGGVIRLTSYGQPLIWDGRNYLPISLSRGLVQEVLAADTESAPSITMAISNIDLQMSQLIHRVELDGASADVYVTDRRLLDRRRDAYTLASGEIRNAQISENTLIFEIHNAIGIAERVTVPRRIHQAHCNYTFGSKSCGVDLRSFQQILSVGEGGGDGLSIPAVGITTSERTDFYSGGYVVAVDGVNALQARPIQQVVDGRVLLRRPFLSRFSEGDTIIVRRGCTKTMKACQERQGNTDNFGGFPDVPYGRIRPVKFPEPEGHSALFDAPPEDGEVCDPFKPDDEDLDEEEEEE
jgi:uncharacterized phage protein (TIGR02218 family)